jgi:hypothetical protein
LTGGSVWARVSTMVLLASHWRRRLTLALLSAALGLVPACSPNVEKTAAPAAAPVPAASSVAATKEAEPLPGQGKFDTFKKDLFQPLEPFGPRTAMDRVMNPRFSPRFSPADQKAQDQMEQRRNWVFTDLNDLHEMSKPEDGMMKFMPELQPEKEALKKLPPMERYYQEMTRAQGLNTNAMGEMMSMAMGLKGPNATNMMNPMVMMLQGTNDLMRAMLLAGDPEPPDKTTPVFTAAPLTLEVTVREQKEKRRLEEFKRLLDPTLPELPPPNAHVLTAMEQLLQPAPATPTPVAAGGLPGGLPGAATAPLPSGMTPAFGIPAPAANTFNPMLPGNPFAISTPLNLQPKPVNNNTPTKPPDVLDNYPKRKF